MRKKKLTKTQIAKQESEVQIDWKLTSKQYKAFEYLLDHETIEILFGGGAGGGKSMFGCGFAIYMCQRYQGIRGFIAREELKTLKESTLLTFFDVCRRWNLRPDRDYVYNQQANSITFLKTESVIYLKEAKQYPSDPDFDYLGSTEYTFGFIDEASQIVQKAKNILRSRIRYKLKENGLKPKLLLTCNPHKGYLYSEFYKPSKEGKLIASKAFVQALPHDNQFLDPSYIQNLMSLDKQTKERLLYGNWEYDDDPSALMEYDAITDLFSNNLVVLPEPKRYLIVDVARFGDDRSTVGYYEDWDLKKVAGYKKMPVLTDPNNPHIKSLEQVVKEWKALYRVPLSNILVDEDGVGGGLKDRLGCRGFMGGRKPFKSENYLNLRAQAYYYLAKKVNKREIAIRTENITIRNLIIEELEQIKAHNRDKDTKLQIVPKEMIKQNIGRSPDFSDNLMMRAYFELAPKPQIKTYTLR